MTTDTATGTDELAIIVGEAEVACEFKVTAWSCPNPAKWWSICPLCGHLDGCCDEHHDWFIKNRLLLKAASTVRCTACRKLIDPYDLAFERISR